MNFQQELRNGVIVEYDDVYPSKSAQNIFNQIKKDIDEIIYMYYQKFFVDCYSEWEQYKKFSYHIGVQSPHVNYKSSIDLGIISIELNIERDKKTNKRFIRIGEPININPYDSPLCSTEIYNEHKAMFDIVRNRIKKYQYK